jgi:hypothetical protein
MQYGRTSAEIAVGKKPAEKSVQAEPFIPLLEVKYIQ